MCCNRLEVEDLNCISKSQTGFRNEHPTSDIILTLYFISDLVMSSKKKLLKTLFDFKGK